MGVIKSIDAPPKLTSFSMHDIEAQAHAIIGHAKNQAARIITEAQRISAELKDKSHAMGMHIGQSAGYAEGLKEGHAAGRDEALHENRAALTELITTLANTVGQLESQRRMLEAEAASDVLRLAIAIARKVTHNAALGDDAVLTDNLREAMKLAIHASDVRIAVHPSQKSQLESTLPALQIEWPALRHVAILDDESIDRGGCRISTAGGQIDASLQDQITRIASELLPENGTTDEHR